MKKIVHASEAISLSALSEKFREEGFLFMVKFNSKSLCLTKNKQSVVVRPLKGDKIFELTVTTKRGVFSEIGIFAKIVIFEVVMFPLLFVLYLIIGSLIYSICIVGLLCAVCIYRDSILTNQYIASHKAILDSISQIIKGCK